MSEQKHTPKRKLGWVLIPPYIMGRTDLSDSEKIVYGKIKGLISDRGYCFATNEYLAENVLKSPDRISKVISALRDKKLINVKLTKRHDDTWTTERRIYLVGTRESVLEPDEDEVVADNQPDIVTDDDSGSREQLVEDRESIETETPETADEVSAVWEHFIAVSKTKPLKSPARIAKIKTRLKTWSVDDIKQAIDRCFADSFYTGGNDRGWKADADYIFRTDEIIERLMNLQPKRVKLAPGEYDINVPGVGSFKKTVDAAGVTRVLSFYQHRLNQVEAGMMPEGSLPDIKLASLEAKATAGIINATEKLELEDLRVSVPKILAVHEEWKKGKYDTI